MAGSGLCQGDPHRQFAPTVTPTPQATTAPGATPSPTPSATPTDTVVRGFFAETQWKTSSGDFEIDGKGGLHLVHAYYEAAGGEASTGAAYQYCAGGCEDGANWRTVHFDGLVKEIQLQLTATGQPRLLMRMNDSAVYNGGSDYNYAECNTNCDQRSGWTVVTAASSFGTSLFDLNLDNLPQRYFALDPAGKPRFLYLDRNYPIEPDHYGLFYVACDQDCTTATNWTQTLVTQVIQEEFFFDWEVVMQPALTFTPQGQPRFIGEMIPLATPERDTAIFYFACDSGCDQKANWGRVKIGERGQGSDLSWDLAVDSQGRPRVAHFPEALPDDKGDRLYYLWCDSNCLDATNWQQIDLGLPTDDGQEPDLELDSLDRPRLVHADASTGGIGYSWCNSNCGVAGQWNHVVIDSAADLTQQWPVPYPVTCDAGLWAGLTPTLALTQQGDPAIAYDATYHARCLYQDPTRPNDPPYYRFHLVMRTVKGVYFAQPH